jgi:hypothetical protein
MDQLWHLVRYGLHPGMLIRYLKGEYVGESRRVPQILQTVSPHISKDNANHIH